MGADSSFELIIYNVLCSPVAPNEGGEEEDASAGVFTSVEAIMSLGYSLALDNLPELTKGERANLIPLITTGS